MRHFIFLLLSVTALSGMASVSNGQSLAEMGQVTNVQGTMTGNATGAANRMATGAPAPAGGSGTASAASPSTGTAQVAALTPMRLPANPGEMNSLFFTSNELTSIMRANQGILAPKAAYDEKNQGEKPVDMGARTITLSGIVYNGPNDWTAWVNGERVTPKNIPERITAITVQPGKIRLKWFDIGNQRVINLSLSPHQRYDLDRDTITPANW